MHLLYIISDLHTIISPGLQPTSTCIKREKMIYIRIKLSMCYEKVHVVNFFL